MKLPYSDDIDLALTAFRDLRRRWETVASSEHLDPAVIRELSTLLNDARNSVTRAERQVVSARQDLVRPSDYTFRRQIVRKIAMDSNIWITERTLLALYLPGGTVEAYRRKVKKVFTANSLPPPPLAAANPISDLANRLSVPDDNQKVRFVRRYAQRQLHSIDAILIILANTQSPNSPLRFEMSYVLSTTVSFQR